MSPPQLAPGVFSSAWQGWAVVSAARATAACGTFCMLLGEAGGRKGSMTRPLQRNFEGLGIESSLSLAGLVCRLGIIRKCSSFQATKQKWRKDFLRGGWSWGPEAADLTTWDSGCWPLHFMAYRAVLSMYLLNCTAKDLDLQ